MNFLTSMNRISVMYPETGLQSLDYKLLTRYILYAVKDRLALTLGSVSEDPLIERINKVKISEIKKFWGQRRQLNRVVLDWRHDHALMASMDVLGQERTLRRLRLVDLARVDSRVKTICELLTHMSYPFLVNLSIWAIATNFDYPIWNFEICASIESYRERSAKISNYVKSIGEHSTLKTVFAELNCLEGYCFRAEFDMESEVRKLASPEIHHSKSWEWRFGRSCERWIPETRTQKVRQTFEEYIKSGGWLTSGSSSIGRIDWEYDKIHGHFKARKNMLTFIYTPEELWTIVAGWDGEIRTKPLIKNELGKIRLAVASNIESYLWESYILSCYGHDYKMWGIVTLDERPSEEFDRVQRMSQAMANGEWALPWDFKSFDHQVTTKDIQTILSVMRHRSQRAGGTVELDACWLKVIASYERCYIYHETWHHVSGGLQSGQRTTSLIGNIWNYVVLKMCLELIGEVTGSMIDFSNYQFGVRGDDTYIIGPSPHVLYLIRLGYQSLGAIGNNAKFSIRQSTVEFLRNEIGPKGQYGWPNRAIASITQRKPWASEEYNALTEVAIIADNIRNVERRLGFELPTIHHANKLQWSKFTGQSYIWLTIPRHLGGIGAYQFGGWIADKKLSLLNTVQLPIKTRVVSQENVFATALGLDQIALATHQLSSIARSEVPLDIRTTSLQWQLKTLRQLRPKFSKVQLPPSKVKFVKIVPTPKGWNKKLLHTQHEKYEGHDFPAIISFYNSARHVDKRLRLGELIKRFFPLTFKYLQQLERHGFHRGMAIDIILGNLPTVVGSNIHPILIRFVQQQIDDVLDNYKKGRGNVNLQIISDSIQATHNVAVNIGLVKYYQY